MTSALSERENFLRRLEAAADEALGRGERIEKAFRFNGRPFVLRFSSPELARTMTRPLSHLAVDDLGETPSLTIDCWDVASSGVPCPLPDWPRELWHGRGQIRGLDSPEMRIAYFNWIKLLNVYCPGSGRAFYCIPEARHFPVQQLGSPALSIFNWWCGTLGWQFTHAACVGTERAGVLIIGHGGAGKSTLTFSVLGPPLHYLSDDYCVLTQGDPPGALALYSTGKLSEASLCLLPHLQKHAANATDRNREKALFFLAEEFPGLQIYRVPLKAVVLSKISSFGTALVPISPHEALGIVADSSMRQLAGSAQADFLRLTRIMRQLPAYRLDHGLDCAEPRRLLLELCES